MPASARIVLVFLIGLLLVILGGLITVAIWLRKRPTERASARSRPGTESGGESLTDVAGVPVVPGAAGARSSVGSIEGMALETGGSSLACPTCRREYQGGLVFCPHDARRLVPTNEMERSRSGGSVCPRCRRAFDPGVRFCPHDAAELVPVTLYEATRGTRAPTAPTGVEAKICPQCRERYDLAATFCGRDGSELLTVN